MLISICMATYNGGNYIREQMDSILAQEFKENPDTEMEIIISDDGSTDETLQILEAYNDPRIKIIHHNKHKNYQYYKTLRKITDNFVNAIDNAKGEYLFLSDQDDIWYPWKVDRQLTQLKNWGG